jgi:hypothetical protein
MLKNKFILPLTAILASSLMSCASPSGSNTSETVPTPNTPNTTTSPTSSTVTDKNQVSSETILDQVINRQQSLQVCNFEFNREAAREFSQVHIGENNQHLVQLLCFMAAYQGAFTFLEVDTSGSEMKITPLEIEMAGFPTYDPKTKILANAYKLTGAGTCVQETQHYWNGGGGGLQLISSEFISQAPNGCQDAGALTPSETQLITNKNVGVAKLGMTLAELKKALGEGAKFEPTSLGVDAGEGIKVIQDGNVQYLLGFADANQRITDNSRITMITVTNPNYRTKDGVGPGTLVKTAVAAYGQATLSYNWNNEGREYIKFARGLGADTNILMRSNQWTETNFAGIYADTNAEFNQTQKYADKATIASITIIE